MPRLNPQLQIGFITDSGDIPSLYVRHLNSIELTTLNHRLMHSYDLALESIAGDADLLIVQRWLRGETRAMVEKARNRGIPIVYETDDNLLELPDQSRMKFSPELLDHMRYAIGVADVVTVSTPALARRLSELNRNIVVIPNFGVEKPAIEQKDPPHLVVVNSDYFKLGATKQAFFEAISFAVRELGYRASFHGTIDPLMERLAADEPSAVTIVDYQTNDHSAFLDLLAASGANVALVPLEDTEGHRYKSDIKYLDFGAIGIPGVYNNATVYADVVHQHNGYICEDSFEGWVSGLRYFASRGNRVACGTAAREQIAAKRSLAAYAEARTTLYARLLNGESGFGIAHPSEATPERLEKTAEQFGLTWLQGHLYAVRRGIKHHIVADALLSSLLNDHAMSYVDDEDLHSDLLRNGPTLRAIGEADVLLKATTHALPRESRPGKRVLNISWISPPLLRGSGGHRNILRCAYQLERLGHNVNVYFVDTDDHDLAMRKETFEYFYPINGDVGRFVAARMAGDIVIPTLWNTVRYAEKVRDKFKEIVYFVQDYEPSFYPMGSEHLLAESTYRKGFYAITSGRWCEKFLRENFKAEADHFVFPVDREIYRRTGRQRRDDLLIFFAKPEMPRRAFELGAAALEVFHRLKPKVEIGFFGSSHAANIRQNYPVTHFGVLPTIEDLAELYRRATVGLVFSTTNPSLVPYEMMACGLPVVDLARPGNEANYDNRYDIARLVAPEPSRMAAELAELFDAPGERAQRSVAGVALADTFPSEEDVGLLIERLLLRRAESWGASDGGRA